MWEFIEKPKTVKITPALAAEFRDMKPAPGDRPLQPTRIERLRDAVEQGQFTSCVWASVFCEETGETLRANGKHTSHLFCELNGHGSGHFTTLHRMKAATLEDVAEVYSTYDSRVSVRTTGDINAIYSHTCPELSGIAKRIIDTAVTGMSFSTWQDQASKHTASERASLLIRHVDFVCWFNDICHGGNANNGQSLFCRGPIAAALYATFEKDPEAAAKFWTSVRDETGKDPSSPERMLPRFLLKSSIGLARAAKGGDGNGKRNAGRREMYVKCIHAWNAWRRGAKTDLKYYHDAKLPAVL